MNTVSRFMVVIFLLYFSTISRVDAAETFFAGVTEFEAPIIVDGDLGEWDSLTFISIEQINGKYSSTDKYNGIDDLSIEFSSYCDKTFIYFAVNVEDDQTIFGEIPVGVPIEDDCVEIRLYGKESGSSPMKVWISADKNGIVRLEGRELGSDKLLPYLWQKKGIKAEIKKTDSGYAVEVAIPHDILDSLERDVDNVLEANILVFDDDDNDFTDTIIQWNATSDFAYSTISYTKNVPGFAVSGTLQTVPGIAQEVQIILGSPDNTEETVDYEVQLGVARAFEKAKLHSEAILELEKVIAESADVTLVKQSKSALARNLYIVNNLQRSKQLCEELLNFELDPELELNVRMVLMSIDRKENPKIPFHK